MRIEVKKIALTVQVTRVPQLRAAPAIRAVTPSPAGPGAMLSISGQNLVSTSGPTTVFVGGAGAWWQPAVLSAAADKVSCQLPPGLLGAFELYVETGSQTATKRLSAAFPLEVHSAAVGAPAALVQASGAPHQLATGAVPPGFERLLARSTGSGLPSGVRARMESFFGADLAGVRLHTGPTAADAADRIGAHAFTLGSDVFFGRGQYAPGTPGGMALLGHELTHVLQEATTPRARGLTVGGHDRFERQAESVEHALSSGARSISQIPSLGALQRKPAAGASVRRSPMRSRSAGILAGSASRERFGETYGSGPLRRKPRASAVRRSATWSPSPSAAPASGGSGRLGGGEPGTVHVGKLTFRFAGAASGPGAVYPKLRPTRAVARASGGAEQAAFAPVGLESLLAQASGFPVPDGLRGPLEGLLGADFSGVRLHADSRAYAAADQVSADAFTLGQDIFFAYGAYDPRSARGQALIGHELTHVAQHLAGRGEGPRGSGITVAGHDVFEREAEATERALLGSLGSGRGVGALASVGATPGGASLAGPSFGGGAIARKPAVFNGAESGVQPSLGEGMGALAGRIQRKALGASSPAAAIHRRAGAMVRRAAAPVRRKMFGATGAGADGISASTPGAGALVIRELAITWADAGQGVIQRKAGPEMALAHPLRASGAAGGRVPDAFHGQIAASGGMALPPAMLGSMQDLFGVDLSHVRVHTDPFAQEAAALVGAEAFTLGEDIFFNANRFSPNTARGMALIAHELTHVAQGKGAAPTFDTARAGAFTGDGRLPLSPGGGMWVAGHDALERQAEVNEAAVLRAFTGGGGLELTTVGYARGDAFGMGGGGGLASGYPGALALKAEEAAGGPSADVPPGDTPEVNEAVELFKQVGKTAGTIADLGIGFVPVVGDLYDLLCGVVGRALFTWQKLDVFDRILCIAGVLPIPLVTGGILRRGKRALSWVLSEKRAARFLANVIGKATAFVKKHLGRLKSWFSSSRMVRAAQHGFETAATLPARLVDLVRDVYTTFKASKKGGSEVVKKLEEACLRLEQMMQKHGIKHTTQAAYYEYRALRTQGYSAQEAHGLIKRFRSGESVDGFAWHFTDNVGGQGITQSGKLRAGQGYLGHGVYAGATPTPSVAQQRVPIYGWGLDQTRDVRIPVRMGEGKEAFSAVLPTKTYVFEVTEDLPLAGSARNIARNDGALQSLYYRYRTMVLAAAGLLGVGTLVAQMLFKDRNGGDRATAFAERLRARGLSRLSSGVALDGDPEAFAREWSSLSARDRERLTRLGGEVSELDKPGLPLEWSVRSRLEGILGRDLSAVRLHTGQRAEKLASDMEAHAFTFGHQIVMGEGSYAPDTVEGLGTLVHEATHVVQDQRGLLHGPASEARTVALESEAYGREHAFVARAQRGGARPPALEPVFREAPIERVAAPEDLPNTTPRPAVTPALSKALRKAVDERPESLTADSVQRVMRECRVDGLSREEFLEELRERVMDLIHDDLELANERRETLAWDYDRPLA